MKAVIMAGGEGSRLRPLTCGRPKPMVPIMNRPIMEHIVHLLKRHNLKEIAVTLQYMPAAIRDYFGSGSEFGVKLRYYVEDVPLGTAGSVKNAAEFLDETFVVISGDALTDFDLSRAIEMHREKGAIATLVLTRVDSPLEYGVVITDDNGRIRRFLEKPSWGEVFSDTVNTGIYILEPEVLNYFEPGRKFDFSKDLFPLLLEKGQPLYGAVLPGYWCDIGNLEQYLHAHYDILSGKVQVQMPGQQISSGVWAGDSVNIHPAAKIEPPVLLGAGTTIGANARVEPYTVVGENCNIGPHSSLKRSVLWNNINCGTAVSVRGGVIGSRVQIRKHSAIYEGAVIGSDSQIEENCIIKPHVKLWPQKVVTSGSIVQDSIIWGTKRAKRLFGLEGIAGLVNLELTPEIVTKLAAAFASTLKRGAKAAVSSDPHPASQLFRRAVTCGLQSGEVEVHDLGQGITPMLRFAVRKYNYDGGMHIKISSINPATINIIITDEKGSNLPRSKERKIENVFAREDFRRSDPEQLPVYRTVPGVRDDYLSSLVHKIDKESIRRSRYRVVMAYDRQTLGHFIEPLCQDLQIQARVLANSNWRNLQDNLEQISSEVVKHTAALGIVFDHNADRIVLVDDKGRIIRDDMLTALIALIVLRSHGGPVFVPVTAPSAIETLAEKYAGKVIRTKTAVQDFLEQLILEGTKHEDSALTQFLMNFDGLFAFCNLLDFLFRNNISLSKLVEEIPAFFLEKKNVKVPWEAKGRVIRRLIEEKPGEELELLDGVKVYHPNGWTLVLPDPEEPVCRVFSEGATMEAAEALADFYASKINDIISEGKEAG